MCIRLLLLSILFLASGCAHQESLQVSESDRLAQVNAEAAKRTASVTLHSGEKYSAHALQIAPDSTSWLVPESNEVVSVPTHDVADVRFVNHGRGAINGLGLGATIGGVSGAAIGLLSGDDPPCEGLCLFQMTAGEKAAFVGIGLCLIGGVVGLVTGAVSGSEEVYRVDDQSRGADVSRIDRQPQSEAAQNKQRR